MFLNCVSPLSFSLIHGCGGSLRHTNHYSDYSELGVICMGIHVPVNATDPGVLLFVGGSCLVSIKFIFKVSKMGNLVEEFQK